MRKLQKATNKLFMLVATICLILMVAVSCHIAWVQFRSFDSYVEIKNIEVKFNEQTNKYDFHVNYKADNTLILFSVAEIQDVNDSNWKLCSNYRILTVEPSDKTFNRSSNSGHHHGLVRLLPEYLSYLRYPPQEPSYSEYVRYVEENGVNPVKPEPEYIKKTTSLRNVLGTDCFNRLMEVSRNLRIKVYYQIVVSYDIIKRTTRLSNVFTLN